MPLSKYFDGTTISVHLREGSFPVGKKGVPGNWNLVQIGDRCLSRQEIQELVQEISQAVEYQKKSFIEVDREGSSIIQLGEYRIIVARPPFSDGWEVTAVKPVAKLNLEDYSVDEKLKKRLIEQTEGVLIAGSPGEGKTTLARALAEHYNKLKRIVKTVESPRDMLLGEEITQYSLNHGSRDQIYEVLLLSRPDNTIFDEMRNTEDFKLFADLRLAGIGMVGIVHATNPIDAIQRFIGRIEMGVIPQIIDTVVFVKGGKIDKVLELKMKVKVPTGMLEADLARPVVEIRDFFSGALEFEIYTYGEQTVVIPVEKEEKGINKLVVEGIKEKVKRYTQIAEVEVISDDRVVIYVPNPVIPRMLGKEGREIEKLEKEIGLRIDLRELKERKRGKEIEFDVEARKNITFYLDNALADREIDVYSGEKLLFTARSSKKGVLKINPGSELGQKVLEAVKKGIIRLLLVG